MPRTVLPPVTPSAGQLARITPRLGDVAELADVPITAVLGDSHAALFAHEANLAGGVKVTYGTGSSVMRLIDSPEDLDGGVCTTVAWADPKARLAAEGNIRSTGATVSWLADLLDIDPAGVAKLAAIADAGGIHLVPAFGGLAAPWWDDDAVGLISGLTLGTRRHHLARAAVESIAHQVADVVAAMAIPSDPIAALLADGGASTNDVLMQIQADLTGLTVRRAREQSLSALGAGYLAGQAAGLWSATEPAAHLAYDIFTPSLSATEAHALRGGWLAAIARSRTPTPTAPV